MLNGEAEMSHVSLAARSVCRFTALTGLTVWSTVPEPLLLPNGDAVICCPLGGRHVTFRGFLRGCLTGLYFRRWFLLGQERTWAWSHELATPRGGDGAAPSAGLHTGGTPLLRHQTPGSEPPGTTLQLKS